MSLQMELDEKEKSTKNKYKFQSECEKYIEILKCWVKRKPGPIPWHKYSPSLGSVQFIILFFALKTFGIISIFQILQSILCCMSLNCQNCGDLPGGKSEFTLESKKHRTAIRKNNFPFPSSSSRTVLYHRSSLGELESMRQSGNGVVPPRGCTRNTENKKIGERYPRIRFYPSCRKQKRAILVWTFFKIALF